MGKKKFPPTPEQLKQCIAELPPQYEDSVESNLSQIMPNDLVLVKRRDEQRQLYVNHTVLGIFVEWPMNGLVKFNKADGFGPGRWRIVKILKRRAR